MTNDRTFAGLPIKGTIIRDRPAKPQRPLEEFVAMLRGLVDDPTITEFGWRQCTPYFNDGEPCVFSAYGLWVRTTGDTGKPLPLAVCINCKVEAKDAAYCPRCGAAMPEPGDRSREPDEGELEVWGHPTLGRREFQDGHYTGPYSGPDVDRYDRCNALEAAIDSGEFDSVLLDAFGDHAEITVTDHDIIIEQYHHD